MRVTRIPGRVLGRGEGDVDQRHRLALPAFEGLHVAVVIGRGVDPVIGLRQAQFAGAALEAGIQAERRSGQFHLLEVGQQTGGLGGLARHQAGIGGHQSGAADDLRRAQFDAVLLQAHAHGAAVLDQDLVHAGVGEHLAAGGLDHRDDGLGHAHRAAHRVVAAGDVVLGDHGVHEEGRLARRQAVVAPLGGECADQLLVAGQPFEHFAGALEAVVRQPPAAQFGVEQTEGARHGLTGEELRHPRADLAEQLDITVDGGRFSGEVALHLGLELLAAGDVVDHLFAEDDAVVMIVHRRPVQVAVADHIEHPADHRPGFVHLADVVHAHVPLVAFALVAVGVAAGGVVLLQHADALAQLAQQGGGGQAADARADDDGVVVILSEAGAEAGAGAFHGVLSGGRFFVLVMQRFAY